MKITEYATIEVIPNPDNSLTVANRRMKDICATPEEVERYKYDPLGMRTSNNNPGIPSDDYGQMNGD